VPSVAPPVAIAAVPHGIGDVAHVAEDLTDAANIGEALDSVNVI